ncbi:protein of unknown function [Kingella kingae]|nr:protein of unknown function [Kingella kingae]
MATRLQKISANRALRFIELTHCFNEKLHKEKPNTPTENFTHTAADLAFSDYIRARANYCCERCGKQYPKKSKGL